MKNRPHNYLAKLSYHQIKDRVDQKIDNSELVCEKAMNELKKIYWYEKELLIAIPFLMRGATTFELVESLTILVKYTRGHVKELETNFPSISETTILKTYNSPTQKRSMSKINL